MYKGYKQDKIEMRGDRAEMSDLPHLWHGPVRSLSFTKTVFSEIRGHGGSVTQRVPLRIRVSFYSIFNLHEACLNLGSL